MKIAVCRACRVMLFDPKIYTGPHSYKDLLNPEWQPGVSKIDCPCCKGKTDCDTWYIEVNK